MPTRPEISRSTMAIILFAGATAAIHFSRAVADPGIRSLFILNGLGYLFLVSILYLPIRQIENHRRLVRRILMGYTVTTIALYFVWGIMSTDWALSLGPIDKILELGLLGSLWQEDQRPDKEAIFR